MTAASVKTSRDDPRHRRADDLGFLAAFTKDLAAPRDVAATWQAALVGIRGGLNALSAALYVLDEASGELVCEASTGALGVGERHRPGAVLRAPLLADGRRDGVVEVTGRHGAAPFGERERVFLATMANILSLAGAKARLAAGLVEQEATARELALAAEIQRSLLPRAEPGRHPVFGLNRPIRQVSGDFFDFFPLPDRRIAFALGDVSGKGINAALLMAKAASLYRCLGKRIDDPAAVLEALNHEIQETASRGMFVTMVAGIYDTGTGRLRFANAGHEPPLLRARDHSYRAFPAAAPPLGLVPELEYRACEVDLAGGEFYIFSDGLTEFRYGSQEQLGADGLIQMLEGLSALPLAERLTTVLAELEREGWSMRDDLTVLAIDDSWVGPND